MPPSLVQYDTDARADLVRLPLPATRQPLVGAGHSLDSAVQVLDFEEDEAGSITAVGRERGVASKTRPRKETATRCTLLYA